MKQPLLLEGGRVCYNDGQQFVGLWKARQYPESYFEGMAYLQKEEPQLAITSFEKTLDDGYEFKNVYDGLVVAYSSLKDYEKVLDIFEILHDNYGLQAMDYGMIGDVYSQKKEYPEAVKAYNRAIYDDHKNPTYLYGRACVYQEITEHQLALQDFDTVIYYAPSFSQAYSRRGLSKVKLGDLEGALLDIEQAKLLTPEDPYVYLYLGFYYQKKQNKLLALENFQKAKEMNIDHYGIDYYIHEVSPSEF